MAKLGPLTVEVGSGVWGTPTNFNRFRVLAALLHGTLVVPPSDMPSPVNGILWEMSELITQERIDVGSSNLVEGLIT